MPAIKNGQFFKCVGCGEEFYRSQSFIKRGITRTCGRPACKSLSVMGERNPFWGKGHSDETKQAIAATKRSRPVRNGGRKGYRHTEEAKAKMSQSLKERWASNREAMIARLPKGAEHHWKKTNESPRHRSNFTNVQKREWLGVECAWCTSPDDLVLDHIIPVMAGGKNVEQNAQTLCRPCNLWKTWFVDRPYYFATLDGLGGRN